MKTGIVMEITEGCAVVLSSGGDFASYPAHSSWRVGDVVRLRQTKRSFRPLYALAACFALVAALGGGGWKLWFTESALVSIDVNPSIELSLNRFDRVIAASARNAEAVAVLGEVSPQGMVYDEALSAIIGAENAAGYFTLDANVVVTVYAEDAGRQNALLENVTRSTDSALQENHDGTDAEYHAVDAATVKGAHGCGVTAGKFLYLEQLQAADPQIDIEQFTHHSIPELRGQIEECQKHGANANSGDSFGRNGYGHGHGAGKDHSCAE